MAQKIAELALRKADDEAEMERTKSDHQQQQQQQEQKWIEDQDDYLTKVLEGDGTKEQRKMLKVKVKKQQGKEKEEMGKSVGSTSIGGLRENSAKDPGREDVERKVWAVKSGQPLNPFKVQLCFKLHSVQDDNR